MRKGYPAEQYYGRPADAIEEVESRVSAIGGGAAEGVDEDSARKMRDVENDAEDSCFDDDNCDNFWFINKRNHSIEASELRESFEKKIDFVTDLWRQIESPEVADLPSLEFKRQMLGVLNNLDRVFPNSSSLIKECEKMMKEIAEVSVALRLEENKRQIYGSSPVDMVDALEFRRGNLRTELERRLSSPDFEFVHHCTAFVIGVFLKKTKIEALRELPYQQDKVKAGLEFCRRLESFRFESEYGYDSRSSIVSNENIRRLIDHLKIKISFGENIFNFIEIDPYNICFYLDREDYDKIYISRSNDQMDDNKKVIIYGTHFANTSIIFVSTGDRNRTTEDLKKTKLHEQGHNMVEIAGSLRGLDIHNTVYRKEFIGGLRNTGASFKKLFEQGEVKGARDVAVDYMMTAVHKLNGEISADAKNIVKGYPKALISYVLNLIDSLNEYVLESKSETSKSLDETKTKNAFLQIVEAEIVKLKSKTVDLVVKMVTYAYVARKHGLEDQFCSALVLMPDSEKYLKRVLSIKLGDEFDFELAKKEINPDEIFSDAPDWMKVVARKHFGSK